MKNFTKEMRELLDGPQFKEVLRVKLAEAFEKGRRAGAESATLTFADRPPVQVPGLRALPLDREDDEDQLDPEAARYLMQAMVLAAPHSDAVLSEFMHRVGDHTKKLAFSVAWDASLHPRDDHGRFVRGLDIARARHDPAFAAQLRSRVTNPEERAKLDAQIHHPSGRTTGLSKTGSKGTQAIQETHDHITRLAEKAKAPGGVGIDDLKSLASSLNRHTGEEIQELKGRLGLRAGGYLKVEQVNKIIDRAIDHQINNTRAAVGAPPVQTAALRPDGTPVAPSVEDVHTVPTGSLKRDPERFQYKTQGIGEGGVGVELKSVNKWNPELGGVLSVWRDPETGIDHPVNGHHRHELAERTGQKTVNVRYIQAKDAAMARAKGALQNIAEGRGTALDAAKYMRDSDSGPEDLKAAGVSLTGRMAADALALKGLGDKSFKKLAGGELDEQTAVAVAKHLPDDPAKQDALFRIIGEREENGKAWSTPMIETAARKMARSGAVKTSGSDLFGAWDQEHSTWAEESELEHHVAQKLKQEANNFGAVASQKRADAVKEAGNTLNVAENAKRRDQAHQTAADFDREAGLVGPVADAIKAHAAELVTARTKEEKDAVKQRTLESVRSALAGGGRSVPGAAAVGEPGRPQADAGGAGGGVGGRVADGGTEQPAQGAAGAATAAQPAPNPAAAAIANEPPKVSSFLSADEQKTEKEAQQYARDNFDKVRAAYLGENATADGQGGYRSVVMNTDEFRHHLPGYVGTNAGAVHTASDWANRRLTAEMMQQQAGKGNNTMLILAGGGGSGKGTATGQFFDQREYPLVLDQTSDTMARLAPQLDAAKKAGFDTQFTFIDRAPEDAWSGVVGRAVGLRQKGKLARTVPLGIAVKANMNARKTALELLETRMDIAPSVVDNNRGMGNATLLTDREEAKEFLRGKIAEDEKAVAGGLHGRLERDIAERHLAGEIPEDLAHGFVGKDRLEALKRDIEHERIRVSQRGDVPAVNAEGTDAGPADADRRDQLRPTDAGGAVGQGTEPAAAGQVPGTGAEGGGVPATPGQAEGQPAAGADRGVRKRRVGEYRQATAADGKGGGRRKQVVVNQVAKETGMSQTDAETELERQAKDVPPVPENRQPRLTERFARLKKADDYSGMNTVAQEAMRGDHGPDVKRAVEQAVNSYFSVKPLRSLNVKNALIADALASAAEPPAPETKPTPAETPPAKSGTQPAAGETTAAPSETVPTQPDRQPKGYSELEDEANAAGFRNLEDYADSKFGMRAAAKKVGETGDIYTSRAMLPLVEAAHHFQRKNYQINRKVRAGEPLDADEQKTFDTLSKAATEHALPSDALVYRAIGDGVDFEPGKTISDPGLGFASYSKHYADNVAVPGKKRMMVIDAEAGAPAMYLGSTEPASRQMVFPPNAQLEVTGVDGDTVYARYRKPQPAAAQPEPESQPAPAAEVPAEQPAPQTPTEKLEAATQDVDSPSVRKVLSRLATDLQGQTDPAEVERLAGAAALDLRHNLGTNPEAHDAADLAEQIAAQHGPPAPPDPAMPDEPPAEPQTDSAAANPHVALADHLADKFRAGETVSSRQLFTAANHHHGGTRAEGKYGPSDAYDSMEVGLNKALAGHTDPRADLAGAQEQARQLAERVKQLPTQTNRSGNKDAFQQFSTPPHYSFAAAWVANLNPNDHVLEPSAGTGSLAVHAANAGAKVTANELDPRRADLLKSQFGEHNVHTENAEQIGGILPNRGVNPSVVLMNPPFSQTAGRLGNKKELMAGANHIAEAASTLPENGRVVAIVGRGMTPESPTYRDWFKKMKEKGLTLRANMGVEGDEYAKYGTKFGTRMLVFDKAKIDTPPVTGDAADIPDLMQKLEGVRNDRPQTTPVAPVERAGDDVPATTGGAARPDDAGPAATGGGVDGAERAGGDGGSAEAAGGVADAPGGTPAVGPGGVRHGSGGEPAEPVADPGRAPGQPDGGTAAGGRRRKGGKAAGGKPAGGGVPRVPELRPHEPVRLKADAETGPAAAGGAPTDTESHPPRQSGGEDSLYESYRPARLNIPGAQRHQSNLVESAAMSGVKPPEPTYQPHLSPDLVAMKEVELRDDEGNPYKVRIGLSEAGLESVVYSGQAHQKFLPAGEGEVPVRRGYFIGDGTGAGKGRQIAGIMTDNNNQGRQKHVWVTMKKSLLPDAIRDWRELGNDPSDVHAFEKIQGGKRPDKGVAVITYDTLKTKPKDAAKQSNMEVLSDWLGPDFDGVIAFDEAHSMANAMPQDGERGQKEASARALSGVELQKRFPNARVVYVSATGATEVGNLAYADRLGLWGRGTPFPDKQTFVAQMEDGGLAAMESVAQSLKAQGSYGARSLSFDDGTKNGRVTYDRLTHALSPDQETMYNGAAGAWQQVLKHVHEALGQTGGKKNKNAKSAALSQFWGAQQRFFNQLMTSMQTPSVINSMEQDLKEGRAPVVQLVNTMEAATKRAAAKRDLDDENGYENLDISPREVLMQYLERSFPVHRFEEVKDPETGAVTMQPVKDSDGNHVTDPEAVATRERLLDEMGSLKIPESPLDMILNHFGHDQVAEATGRTSRLLYKEQPDGSKKRVLESRTPNSANVAEANAFQAGKKKIMIFSDAGGTGKSYHADVKAQNQNQRVHYMLQPGWRADNAVQGLGRTHRTGQVIAPTYRLVEIDKLKAQKRFISTIARRLDQLGALTKGQRQAGSSGLFSAADNLESKEAKEALERLFSDVQANRVPGLNQRELMEQLGYANEDDEKKAGRSRGRPKQFDTPPMSQFLNRMLSLNVDTQGKVFDAFEERLNKVVEAAVTNGTLDQGMENFRADHVEKKSEAPVYTDPDSGAQARLLKVTARTKTERAPFEKTLQGDKPLFYVRNKKSGRVRAVYKWGQVTDPKTGKVTENVVLRGPNWFQGQKFEPSHTVNGYYHDPRYERLSQDDAKKLWDEEYGNLPQFHERDEHFLTGSILPIWDRIPGGRARVYRVKTDNGEIQVGRHVSSDRLPELLKNLGVQGEKVTAADAHAKLAAGQHSAKLANGWELRPAKVGGERRIELHGDLYAAQHELQRDGVIRERVGYDTRYFVPTGADGAKVLDRITASRPIVDVIQAGRGRDD